ncbi:hypothetical protein GOP47_0003765 [Adiantum capillus-veneris]|uniref:FYVE-type domain-containing protein n=1 Tax=Adiantum capillus-veneris TaxID=13818 RepID=A0A9D4V6W9_ADICA|nr:hypothetical protein GOP47_0003765 [Adiantum capillus-veneris]
MLEKLPPKPSLKGNEWVSDASLCQACSSAFTFFNRKHHCRRCGGIFCGSCTQQRVNLRGQGDGPVRVCDACKKLEDAARFELRSGYRHKVSKGASKSSSSTDPNPLLIESLGQDPTTKNIESTALMEEVSKLISSKHDGSTALVEPYKAENDGLVSAQLTPEMLLLQAQEEKQQWLALKKEGKGNEALQAFKRSKELERQAENLKLSIKRAQRKATTSTIRKEKYEEISRTESNQKMRAVSSEDAEGVTEKAIPQSKSKKGGFKEGKEKTDDLMDALKELGWNDADLVDAGGKQNKVKTVESELAELAARMQDGNEKNRQKGTSSMEVLAHKRKALALKKEGNMAEAKEELKKAKLLERQLEEQQLLGGEEDESDDDLRALMGEIDKESKNHRMDMGMDMDISFVGNIQEDDDQGFEVTDVDMDDPEMVAALKSMGWEEEAAQMEQVNQRAHARPKNIGNNLKPGQSAPDRLNFLEGFETTLDGVEATEDDMKDPYFLSTLRAMGFEEEEPAKLMQPVLSSVEDKRRLQQEVQFLKKEALALKRAGKLQEAKEELRRAKHLEKELHDVRSYRNDEEIIEAFSAQQQQSYFGTESEALDLQQTSAEDTENVDVTEEDMGDPELAKTLKSLGWQDDPESDDGLVTEVEPSEEEFRASHNTKSKSELQKELLGIKRAALKLRREGKVEAAEEELKKAHIVEQLMEESGRASNVKKAKPIDEEPADITLHIKNVKVDLDQPDLLKSGHLNQESSSLPRSRIEQTARPSSDKNEMADESFRDAGRKVDSGLDDQHLQETEVRPNLTSKPGTAPVGGEQEKVLEGKDDSLPSSVIQPAPEKVSSVLRAPNLTAPPKESSKGQDTGAPLQNSATADPLSMHASQQQILSLKKQALALKREGRQLEAKEKLKEAKLLERMLVSDSASYNMDEVQMPLQHCELEPVSPPTAAAVTSSKQPSNTPNTAAHKSTGKDRMKLQQESLAHKRKALALRREGKTEAADMEFEVAKSIEKQMEELGSAAEGPSAMPKGDDSGMVEDIFDPQLLAALQGLGWKKSDLRAKPPLEKPQPATHKSSTEAPTTSTASLVQNNEKEELEQKIKSEKIRALNLKRAGHQTEALEALRGAKLLEKILQSMK